MLQFMLFKITSVQIFFIAALHSAYVLFALFLFFYVSLRMLLQVCCRSERFAAFLTDERLFVLMNLFVTIQIRFLVETLLTVLEVTRVGFLSGMNYFMTNKSRFQVKLLFALVIRTCVYFGRDIMANRTITLIVLLIIQIILLIDGSMPASHYSIISSIASNTVIFILLLLYRA